MPNTSNVESSIKVVESFIEILGNPFVFSPETIVDFSELTERLTESWSSDINQLAKLVTSWSEGQPYIYQNLMAVLSPTAGPGNKDVITPLDVEAYKERIIKNTMRLSASAKREIQSENVKGEAQAEATDKEGG
jgi:hypothetical protein